MSTSEETAAKALLSSALDWRYILTSASKNGVAPLVHWNLKKYATLPQIDPKARGAFEQLYYQNSLTNMEIAEEAKRVLMAFFSHSVKTIGLKGVFLTTQIYKNLALRPGADLDLLIHKDDLAVAHEALTSLGYRVPKCYHDFLQMKGVSSLNSLVYNADVPADFLVHLHWHIVNSSWPLGSLVKGIDMERLWAQSVPVDFDGISMRVLSPVHSLIYLCQHALNHFFDRLILACDINESIREYGGDLEWDEVFAEAERFGLHFILCCAFEAVSGGLAVEFSWLEGIEKNLSFLKQRFARSFAQRRCDYLQSYLAYFTREETLFAKMRFLGRTFAPPPLALAHGSSVSLTEIKLADYFRRIGRKIF